MDSVAVDHPKRLNTLKEDEFHRLYKSHKGKPCPYSALGKPGRQCQTGDRLLNFKRHLGLVHDIEVIPSKPSTHTLTDYMNQNRSLPPATTLRDAFLRWIIEKNIPFNALSGESFQTMWRTINNREPPLSRQFAAGQGLNDLFNQCKFIIAKELSDCKYLAVTTDGWTGLQTSFWSITVTGFDSDFNLHHWKLGCRPIITEIHSAEMLANEIKNTLRLYGLDEAKVSSLTTDEGAAAPLIASHFTDADEIHCGAHLLNTVLRNAFRDIVSENPFVGIVMTACRDIAGSFNRSTQVHDQITANQLHLQENVISLKQSVVTRWNSLLANLRSVLESKDAVLAFCYANLKEFEYAKVIVDSDEYFWDLIKCLIQILSIFEESTRVMSSETEITAHLLVFEYVLLQNRLRSDSLFNTPDNMENNRLSIQSIGSRCQEIIETWLMKKFEPFTDAELMAFALHPNYQPRENQETWNRLLENGYTLLQQKLHSLPPSLVTTDGKTDEAKVEVDAAEDRVLLTLGSTRRSAANNTLEELNLFRASKIPITKVWKPNEWWRLNQHKFPALALLARRYLCFPASQTASERDFSQMRLICTHLRNSLDPETAFKLSVVRSTLRRSHNEALHHSSSSTFSSNQLSQKLVSLKEARKNKLKARYRNIVPNPQFSKIGGDDGEIYINYVADNGERESDSDYESEDVSAEYSLDDSEELYQPPPAKRAMLTIDTSEVTYTTRSTQSKCVLKQLEPKLHLFSALFVGLKTPPPPPEKLFGSRYRHVSNWRMSHTSNPYLFFFEATDSAKKRWTSGKQFLRELGEIIPVDPDMYC